VHLYGQVCDMDQIGALGRRHGLFVLEDAAQAHGATWDGRRAGSLGDAGAFSFYPSKNLGALGEGGAVVTSDAGLAERVRELRHIGQRGKGHHVHLGWNERLHGLQAALLRVKLPHLDGWNAARRRHADTYAAALGGAGVQLLCETPRSPCVFHVYPVRVPARDELADRLGAAGIQTGIHYTPACCDQPPLQDSGRIAGDVSIARAWAGEELSLPMAPELRDDEVERVAAAVRRVASGYAAGGLRS
jgi:dTDP-4-amino-4,6-dideoxygalactose transaminase